MGKFKISKITNLDNSKEGDIIGESDYSALTEKGNFVQMSYEESEVSLQNYEVKPGIYTIIKTAIGLQLELTSFVNDGILEKFVNTKDIEDRADCFFKNVHKYKEFGIEIPKRNMLLYGPPGSGKSTSLSKICNKYAKDSKTVVVIFPTEKYEAYQVKDFLKSFDYKTHAVERLILVMEDVGGVEMEEVRRSSDSGLLSLLDNQEKTFTVPTLIVATTNFPEVFMGNLTNRPGRFDDKIEVGFPNGQARTELFKFFNKLDPSTLAKGLLEGKETEEFTPAHIREIVVRSAIYDKEHHIVIKEMSEEIKQYKKAFSKSKSMGLYE